MLFLTDQGHVVGMQGDNMSRFESVQFDESSKEKWALLTKQYSQLENIINNLLEDGRARSVVMTKLEESFMWVGKAIRNDQWKRSRRL